RWRNERRAARLRRLEDAPAARAALRRRGLYLYDAQARQMVPGAWQRPRRRAGEATGARLVSEGGLVLRLQLRGPGRVELVEVSVAKPDGTTPATTLLEAKSDDLYFAVVFCADEREDETGCIKVGIDDYHLKNEQTGRAFCAHADRY